MRISTNSLFDQQTIAIDNQMFNQSQLGAELSTGKKVNQPSDDPTRIGQDLQLHTAIDGTLKSAQNVQGATDELTQVDATMSEVTSALQSARQLTVRAASDVITPTDKTGIANQVEAIIQQLVGLANTNFGGKYLFGGTNISSAPPVQTNGQPITSVNFTGNMAQQGELYADGASISLSTTLQQAFNFNAADGSLNVFQVLVNLRNTLNNTGPIALNANGAQVVGNNIDQSATSVNGSGAIVQGTGTLASQANSFAQPLNVAGNVVFRIDTSGGGQSFTFNPATDSIDTPSAGGGTSVVAAINAAALGVQANWDQKTQKLTLSSSSPFTVTDITGNFTKALGLSQQASVTTNLSRQLGDIDHVLTSTLVSRAAVGQSIQVLSALKNRYNTSITNNTAAQSQIEDTDFPSTVSAFTEAQTALQAAYSTTTRLEAKNLFEYL